MSLVDQFANLPPVAKAALGFAAVLQGAALLAWSFWLVKEIRDDNKVKKD